MKILNLILTIIIIVLTLNINNLHLELQQNQDTINNQKTDLELLNEDAQKATSLLEAHGIDTSSIER